MVLPQRIERHLMKQYHEPGLGGESFGFNKSRADYDYEEE
jgi:hypothetical protein